MSRDAHAAPDGVRFRKSSYSDPDRDCVEIGRTVAVFGVRDSKVSPSPVLAVAAEQGGVFISAIKTGRFDL